MKAIASRPATRTLSIPVPAVVTSCLGAPYGDVNLVRSLGEQGVKSIVISEYPDPPASRSRHCTELIVVPDFSARPDGLRDTLLGLARRLGQPPVVFTSADPDTAAFLQIAPELGPHFPSIFPDRSLAGALLDKDAFQRLAEEHHLPVPRTFQVRHVAELHPVMAGLEGQVIVKPSHPSAWNSPALPRHISSSKALLVDAGPALQALCTTLLTHDSEFLIQEYIPGMDDAHHGFHAHIDRNGGVRAVFTSHNVRVYPPHAGGGCCMESSDNPALEALGLDILKRIGFRGLANMDFKRHAVTGEYKLLEINPRLSQAHLLSTRCGVNMPWQAYLDACGRPATGVVRTARHRRHVIETSDLRAFREYRRLGEWTWAGYLGSVLRPGMVFQNLQWRDPGPAWQMLRQFWLERSAGGTVSDPTALPLARHP